MRRPTDGGKAVRSGGDGAGGPSLEGASLAVWVARYLARVGELVRRRATGSGDQSAHLLEGGVEHLLRGGDAAATRDPPAS
jgi:hypothetical protein